MNKTPSRSLRRLAPLLGLALWMPLAQARALSQQAQDYYAAGADAIQKGNWSGGARQFRKAIGEESDYYQAYDALGECLFNMGDIVDAVTQFKKAYFLNPRYTRAAYDIGRGYELLKKDKDAEMLYQRALAIQPMNDLEAVTLTHYRYGLVLKRQELKRKPEAQDFGPAIAQEEAAVAMDGDFSEAHNELGRLYDLIGRYPAAIGQFTDAINLNPQYAEAWANRGVSHWHDGDWDLALSDCLQSVNVDPKFAGGHYDLGQVVFARARMVNSASLTSTAEAGTGFPLQENVRHSEVERAIDQFRLATGYQPDFVDAWVALGQAEQAYLDYPKAIAAYKTALKLDKRNAEARLGLAQIKKASAYFVSHVPKPTPTPESD